MVMTSDMWHILFEPARENEWIFVMNEERPTERITNEIPLEKDVDITAVS